MSNYDTEPGIDPVRITTFRRMHRKWKFGEPPPEDQTLFDDLFTETTRQR
ncbi:hypothetical protein [Curtobacterium sp. PhB136]|nr:hypothetical protein [Curtobacterium sp. PhB136]TCK63737.1 hypothetical protein EDF27_2283 [Curtobacterium sp. PhB136]